MLPYKRPGRHVYHILYQCVYTDVPGDDGAAWPVALHPTAGVYHFYVYHLELSLTVTLTLTLLLPTIAVL